MLAGSKAASHGKQVSGDGRAQIAGVTQQQQPPGSHGTVKANQAPIGNAAPKSTGQSGSSAGGMLKSKSKRERSISVDSVPPLPVLEADGKGDGVMRSKRRCVLTKKQPYSGDEWCSGPDTDDEDKPRHQRPVQGLSDRLPAGHTPQPAVPVMGAGPGLKAEPSQPSQQLVYVFTTSLANKAAEAVIKGQTETIVQFHQQNIPHSNLEQGYPLGKPPSLPEKLNSITSPVTGTPKSQNGTPRPSSAGAGQSDNESSQTRAYSNNSAPNHRSEAESKATPPGPEPGNGDGARGVALSGASASPSGSPTILSAHDGVQRSGPANIDCLSKEQLAHRERSLQTLRDIERLFLRTAAGGGDPAASNNNGPNNSSTLNSNNDRSSIEESEVCVTNSANCLSGNTIAPGGGMEKYEEPLQSIISQTQSLGGPQFDTSHLNSSHILPQHHQMPSPGDTMGPFNGPEGLSREQIAWRKLKEEYYQEKRRQQDVNPPGHLQHFRMIPEVGVHGGPMLTRGPPPPYHSKLGDQQWGPAIMRSGNGRMLDSHQEGPRGPRFIGQRGQPGAFPGSPGARLMMEGLGPQRPIRPGMVWLEDMPNNINSGGPFQGCYPTGPSQTFQGETELLTREEVFQILEKRQMQGVSRFEHERLLKQQQQANMGSRIIDGVDGPDFPNLGMNRGLASVRDDTIDFPASQEIMGSPGACPQIRDLVHSPLGNSVSMSMNQQMNLQQQQQMMLSHRLRGGQGVVGPLGEMFGRGGNARIIPGPDGSFQFPNQGNFSEETLDGPYPQPPGMFGPDHPGSNLVRGTSRLSHMPLTEGHRRADIGSRQASDILVNLNPMNSPSVPPSSQLRSPSLNQEPSPLLSSPSAPGMKSPISSSGHHHIFPPTSGAGTPCSSLKSPQIMGSSTLGLHSPSASPGHLKSPVMAVGSPGWTSPKAALPSPGIPTSGKAVASGGSGSIETGQSHPPRSSNSTPISQPGSINSSMPFTTSPDARSSQNHLSLIMSQMSKYAVPSTTPLYHDAIKTIATSDDEIMPDRPLLSGVSIGGNMGNPQTSQMIISHGSTGPQKDPQSPMASVGQGQQHLDSSGGVVSSPNQMGMPAMNSVIMGGGASDGMGPSNMSSLSQNPMAGFSRMQPPSHGALHSPVVGLPPNFPHPNDDMLPHQQLQMLGKVHHHQRTPDSFSSLPMGDGPDLSEVIRPTNTGVPEFDLSRIIPSDKPSSTLQYFPKSEPHQNPHQRPSSQQHTPQQLLKQLSSSQHSSGPSCNPHLASLQNMAEQQLPPHPSHPGIRQNMGIPPGGSRGMMSGGTMGPSGHMIGRTGLMPQQQQAMMANNLLHHAPNPYPGMMPPQQHPHNLMAQQNIMMMQAKQRGMAMPGEPFGHQGPMMAPPHPQSGIMGQATLRQRGMSLDSPGGYGGGMANMPF